MKNVIKMVRWTLEIILMKCDLFAPRVVIQKRQAIQKFILTEFQSLTYCDLYTDTRKFVENQNNFWMARRFETKVQ